MQRFVKFDVVEGFDSIDGLTKGKPYHVCEDEMIINDKNSDLVIMTPNWKMPCAHLEDVGFWVWCDKDGNEIKDIAKAKGE